MLAEGGATAAVGHDVPLGDPRVTDQVAKFGAFVEKQQREHARVSVLLLSSTEAESQWLGSGEPGVRLDVGDWEP